MSTTAKIETDLIEGVGSARPAGWGASPEGERSNLSAARRRRGSSCWRSGFAIVSPNELIDEQFAGARTDEEIVT